MATAEELLSKLRVQCEGLIYKHVSAFKNLEKGTGDIFVQGFFKIVKGFQQETAAAGIDIVHESNFPINTEFMIEIQKICTESATTFTKKIEEIVKS